MAAVGKQQLRTALEKHFSREELELLCADLEERFAAARGPERINLEIVGGETLPAQVHNLVAFVERRGLLHELQAAIEQERPGVLVPGGGRVGGAKALLLPQTQSEILLLATCAIVFFTVLTLIGMAALGILEAQKALLLSIPVLAAGWLFRPPSSLP